MALAKLISVGALLLHLGECVCVCVCVCKVCVRVRAHACMQLRGTICIEEGKSRWLGERMT